MLSTLNLHPGAKHPVCLARINPPCLLTGSSTRILHYVEDLMRGLNADIGRKDFFEVASYTFMTRCGIVVNNYMFLLTKSHNVTYMINC